MPVSPSLAGNKAISLLYNALVNGPRAATRDEHGRGHHPAD